MEIKGMVLMQKYELGKMLGKGTFAKVYHARNVATGSSVAIKMIDKEKIMKVGMTEQIEREISAMRLAKHPNIVQLHEVMATKTKIYFVLEYIKGGELFKKIARGKLREDSARKYFQQLIEAVEFCHERGVYHRDLKPENLLLDENGNLKVSDFGLSALAESKWQDGLLHTMCGTPAYLAPEVLNRRGYDGGKADIWSCGVILFVLLAGYLPFRDSNLMAMYRKIGKAEFKYPNWISPDARKLISKTLDPDPNMRISISKIKEVSWFRKGLQSKAVDFKNECKNDQHDEKAEFMTKPRKLNAFDIISLSSGLDLSGLFAGDKENEFKFTSNEPAETIVSKLDEMAECLKMKVTKNDGGLVRLERSKEGRKGVLSIEAEIFEVAPNFHLVEMKKSSGEALEYQETMKRDIRPSLNDIVWTWQGGEPRPQT